MIFPIIFHHFGSMAAGDPPGGARFGRALCQLAGRRLARGHYQHLEVEGFHKWWVPLNQPLLWKALE